MRTRPREKTTDDFEINHIVKLNAPHIAIRRLNRFFSMENAHFGRFKRVHS